MTHPTDQPLQDLIERLKAHAKLHTEEAALAFGDPEQMQWAEDLCEAAAELARLRAALATESSRKCAAEHDCVWQPHCAHAGKCMRPERPFGA